MCGIVVLFNHKKQIDKNIVAKSLIAMEHRGPDASGVFVEPNRRISLGNNRLSFVDPQKRSDQPLVVGDVVITFNGEIYNFRDLKRQLLSAGYVFKTESDTEVIIHAVDRWGPKALLKFNGCFAFILYNRKTQKVFMARDRLGEKQLVYTRAKNGDLMFASEVKGLLVHPDIHAKPNIDRYIAELIFNLYADQNETFFVGIYNFPPGHFCEYDLTRGGQIKFIKYWDVSDVSLKRYTSSDIPGIVKEVKATLIDAVRIQIPETMRIGSILSGGLDSSFITALAADIILPQALPCFTIGYEGVGNRDLKNARIMRDAKTNINLHEIIVGLQTTGKNSNDLTHILEEPVVDTILPSMYENYRTAKEGGLRCVLNGQGSDEQWIGYVNVDPIFKLSKKTYKKDAFAKYWYDSSYFTDFINERAVIKRVKEVIEKNVESNFHRYDHLNIYEKLTRFAIKTHLAALLRHEDRFSMANNIEVRLPYLDVRLVELALSVPANLKLHDGREKFILRKAAQKLLPKAIIQRKKQGFPPAPVSYDKQIINNTQKKSLNNSVVLSAIFGDNKNKLTKLPLQELYVPKAFICLEGFTN